MKGPFLDLKAGGFPVADSKAREVLSIPIGPHLSCDDVPRAASQFLSFI